MYIYMSLNNASVRVILGDILAWMGQFTIVPDVRRTIWTRDTGVYCTGSCFTA